MFEHKTEPLLSRTDFLVRFLRYLFISILILGISLLIGVLGYHQLCGLSWVDSFFNASMILTGMGPAAQMETDAAKIFASLYAIYSGIAFTAVFAIVLAPALHRFMHILHLESD